MPFEVKKHSETNGCRQVDVVRPHRIRRGEFLAEPRVRGGRQLSALFCLVAYVRHSRAIRPVEPNAATLPSCLIFSVAYSGDRLLCAVHESAIAFKAWRFRLRSDRCISQSVQAPCHRLSFAERIDVFFSCRVPLRRCRVKRGGNGIECGRYFV